MPPRGDVVSAPLLEVNKPKFNIQPPARHAADETAHESTLFSMESESRYALARRRHIQLPAYHAADEAAHESTLFSMES